MDTAADMLKPPKTTHETIYIPYQYGEPNTIHSYQYPEHLHLPCLPSTITLTFPDTVLVNLAVPSSDPLNKRMLS